MLERSQKINKKKPEPDTVRQDDLLSLHLKPTFFRRNYEQISIIIRGSYHFDCFMKDLKIVASFCLTEL